MNVKNIDSSKLIAAVSKRPALYDKGNQMYYCHNKFKQRLWKETCAEVVADWEAMPMHKRSEYGREIQKRWKNLRTCFAREVALQKKEHKDILDGREGKRRKRYEYFNRMLFLLNDEQKKEMEQIMSVTCNESVSNDIVDGQNEENSDRHDMMKIEFHNEYDDDIDDDNIMVIEPEDKSEDPFLNTNVIEKVANVNCDEDKLFLMSLLKTFSKFDDRQKFEAKIKILQMLREIQFPED